MTPRIFALSAAVVIAAVLLVAACSAGTKAAPPAAGSTISITDMKFTSPAAVTPGAKVTVTNADAVEHTVTADSGNAFNVEVDEKGTATFTAPSKPGPYAFHCNYHPTMRGQLIVQ
jgi:plastocyanin